MSTKRYNYLGVILYKLYKYFVSKIVGLNVGFLIQSYE